MNTEPDVELIKRFLNGHTEAFNMLVRRWQRLIYHYLYRMVMQREEAEDLTQQVFISVYNNLHRLRDGDKFKSWIYTIAMNKARDYIKSKKNSRLFSLDVENDDDVNNGLPFQIHSEDDTLKNVQQKELQDIIKIALQNIPQEQRDIVILKEYQGLTFKEIAQVIGCSVNTAKSRMYYGLKNLKKALENLSVNMEEYRENM